MQTNKLLKVYVFAAGYLALVLGGTALARCSEASEPTIEVTPTSYCQWMGDFALATGTDRDKGVTKRDATATLYAAGDHLPDPVFNDALTALDLVYLVDLGTPSEVAGLVFDICQETYGKPL